MIHKKEKWFKVLTCLHQHAQFQCFGEAYWKEKRWMSGWEMCSTPHALASMTQQQQQRHYRRSIGLKPELCKKNRIGLDSEWIATSITSLLHLVIELWRWSWDAEAVMLKLSVKLSVLFNKKVQLPMLLQEIVTPSVTPIASHRKMYDQSKQ